jgi:hypothetical protein
MFGDRPKGGSYATVRALFFPDESGISPEGVAIGGRLPEGHLVAVIAMTDFED